MKILVITAHPELNRSRANKTFLHSLSQYGEDIRIHDLYQLYPNWTIDAEKEQKLLLQHDRIVLQFPFYWYSSPPLLKKWLDEVMTPGWAYGPGGNHLIGKEFLVATTTGGTENAYRSGGDDQFTISEFLRPFERTITKCNGTYLPAFVSYSVKTATDEALAQEAARYVEHIRTPLPVLVH
ncbi:glutathione-regulated potassium-efflux system ancillary protein KefG [Paenibacillus catalpae]|uniref:Glutathione-regulated potassium-efflux system ancillary protein KefG n=1 Tax=Paenibacillus catalpae TaxID=1045775 RepID=A0A1I1VC49_9BACL|nr:NAD(P)H-dependent oxidoreductase [Paenibacillus catalpae]SFD78000.1 glutathione-regulated potassium-efflux system ancillary protein KefG [Paenibacillus catalpae]